MFRTDTSACTLVRTLCATGLLVLLCGPAPAADGAKAPEPRRVKDFALTDPDGAAHTAAEWRGRKAVVLLFLGTECPVSNGYAPTFVRLAKEFGPKGVAFYGVYPDPDVTAAAAAKHAAEFKLNTASREMTLLLDPRQALPGQTGVTRVPEAVVLTADGEVRYRGRVDDKYGLDGRRREEPTASDLERAIGAVLAGKAPDPAVTKAFGCPLPPPAKP